MYADLIQTLEVKKLMPDLYLQGLMIFSFAYLNKAKNLFSYIDQRQQAVCEILKLSDIEGIPKKQCPVCAAAVEEQ